jgi:magnesium transporter
MNEIKNQSDLRSITLDGIEWIDTQRPKAETLKYLEDKYNLHPVHVQESLQNVQHTQVEIEDGYLFVVMHFPTHSHHNGRITSGQLGIFLGKDFIITIRNNYSPAIEDLFNQSRDGSTIFKQGSAYLLFIIVNRILNELSFMTDAVTAEIDELENKVFC